MLVVHVGNSAVGLIARNPMLLLELGSVSACPGSAHTHFNPVLVLGRLLRRRGAGNLRFSVRRFSPVRVDAAAQRIVCAEQDPNSEPQIANHSTERREKSTRTHINT